MQEDVRHHVATEKFGRGKSVAQRKQIDAIDLIYQGSHQNALKLLHEVEDESPGRSDVAFNLGTAYELAGDNRNALKWINQGIARNRHSLGGTEWLHVAILEAKIEAAKHPERPLRNHIISMPDVLTADSEIKVGGRSYWTQSVSGALYHQLLERLEFVKPKDPFVGDLLYSYAMIEGKLGAEGNELAFENALALLQMAREYGFPDEALLQKSESRFWYAATAMRLLVWLQWVPFVLLAILLPIWWTCQSRRPESWLYWAVRRFRTWAAQLQSRSRRAGTDRSQLSATSMPK
jgi:hypothetical protein